MKTKQTFKMTHPMGGFRLFTLTDGEIHKVEDFNDNGKIVELDSSGNVARSYWKIEGLRKMWKKSIANGYVPASGE